MSDSRYPCGGFRRRNFLAGALASASLPALGAVRVSAQEKETNASRSTRAETVAGRLGIPGPWPGRVVEVKNPAMIRHGEKDREAVGASVGRGMKELTGADDAVEAWRTLFEPGDVVGIKMNPVGNPLANTSNELMLEVIEGLKSAGVKPKDIIVFERYKDQFIEAGMAAAVPDGIAWTGLSATYTTNQLAINGDDKGSGFNDPLSGYDPDEFITMELVHDGHRPEGRPHPALAPRPARHPSGQQARAAAGAQGPRLGRHHRRAEEHEPRAGQQRRPFAQHAAHQRLQPVHARGRLPPDPPQEVRPADHGRHQGGLPGRPGGVEPEVHLGAQQPVLRHRPRGDGQGRVGHHRRQTQGRGPAGRRRHPAAR